MREGSGSGNIKERDVKGDEKVSHDRKKDLRVKENGR